MTDHKKATHVKTKRMIRSRQRGQSLVEFAIMLTIMLTLLAGAVDLGSAFFAYIALRDAAQEGALYASVAAIVDTDKDGKYDAGEVLNTVKIVQRVRQSSTQPVDLNSGDVVVAVSAATPYCTGQPITVTVTYTYAFTMPLISSILGPTTDITVEATNTILRPACP